MTYFVVDVNVPIVANQDAPQADNDCVLACINALRKICEGGTIVIDEGMLIFSEYISHLKMIGQPRVGDAFMKWVWENQAVIERCERVTLTPIPGEPGNFTEFPNDAELETFDRSDRKYVAVALASRNHPIVLNAVDHDWWENKEALKRNGIRLRFLCPQHME
jgi:hypothetical protein